MAEKPPIGPAGAAERFGAAADLLAQPGAWCRGVGTSIGPDGAYVEPRGRTATSFSIVGAVVRVGASDDFMADLRLLAADLGLGQTVTALADWNDAPDRTQAEVVGTLRALAAKIRPAPEPMPEPLLEPLLEPQAGLLPAAPAVP